MKTLFIALLLFVMSVSLFSQTYSSYTENTANRIGVVGNIWHPIGLFYNHDFGTFGFYLTAKSNFERDQIPVMNQFNFTGGLSVKIFTKTSRDNASDILLGVSYNTDPKNMKYANDDYTWGVEALILFPFTDKNFRLLGGWSSNSVRWAEGVTLGFGYQF